MARGHCLNIFGSSGGGPRPPRSSRSVRYVVEPSLFHPLPPLSPSLIGHLPYVDVKQNVYLLTYLLTYHRQSDEHWNCFKGNVGEKLWERERETGWRAYGFFRAQRYHLELNWPERKSWFGSVSLTACWPLELLMPSARVGRLFSFTLESCLFSLDTSVQSLWIRLLTYLCSKHLTG